MLQVHRQIELREPVLLCAFSGWSDAATAASGALAYLLEKWDGQELARYDPEVIYNYTVTRPVVRMSRGGPRELQWPALTWTALPMPDARHDLVVLLGPEPDLRWQGCARSVADLAKQLGIEQVVGLGCFLASVPHTAPVPLIATATEQGLRHTLRGLGLGETSYQGPTGFLTAVLDAARQRGIPAGGIWGAAPGYLPGMPNAKVSAALLITVERLLRIDLRIAELQTAGRDLEQRIDEALRERPDLRELVERLQANSENAEQPAAEEPPELPSADVVLQDLEQYLQELQRPDEER